MIQLIRQKEDPLKGRIISKEGDTYTDFLTGEILFGPFEGETDICGLQVYNPVILETSQGQLYIEIQDNYWIKKTFGPTNGIISGVHEINLNRRTAPLVTRLTNLKGETFDDLTQRNRVSVYYNNEHIFYLGSDSQAYDSFTGEKIEIDQPVDILQAKIYPSANLTLINENCLVGVNKYGGIVFSSVSFLQRDLTPIQRIRYLRYPSSLEPRNGKLVLRQRVPERIFQSKVQVGGRLSDILLSETRVYCDYEGQKIPQVWHLPDQVDLTSQGVQKTSSGYLVPLEPVREELEDPLVIEYPNSLQEGNCYYYDSSFRVSGILYGETYLSQVEVSPEKRRNTFWSLKPLRKSSINPVYRQTLEALVNRIYGIDVERPSSLDGYQFIRPNQVQELEIARYDISPLLQPFAGPVGTSKKVILIIALNGWKYYTIAEDFHQED